MYKAVSGLLHVQQYIIQIIVIFPMRIIVVYVINECTLVHVHLVFVVYLIYNNQYSSISLD